MINIVNTLLCILIFILGFWAYNKKKDSLFIYIAAAFGIFGLSHMIILLGRGVSLADFVILIRVPAYLLVLVALYRAAV
ncbi:MAG: hypothetical protein WC510_03590 [Candidatus Omnitrophota bacterium]